MRKQVVICPCSNLAAGEKIVAIADLIKAPPPAVLDALGLDADAYEALMPSAVASLAGTHRSLQQAPREAFVVAILNQMKLNGLISDFIDNTHEGGRYDFSVLTHRARTVALDAKGGEGNSITISSRPLHCHEFGIWCHFTGSLAKAPGVQARAVASRMLKVMLNREEDSKRYDFLIVWDGLCGSGVRPCPLAGNAVFPCAVLFPQVQPTKSSSHPAVHDLTTTELPSLLFDHLGLSAADRLEHVWQCDVELYNRGTQWYRKVKFIRVKDGSVQELAPTTCNPEDVPKPTP